MCREGPFHPAILLFFHPSILPYFHTPSFHSDRVSRPRGFCSCQGHCGPVEASCSGPAGASPSRPAGASCSGPAGAYNISLVSSSNLHARIAIRYTFLLPIHSDVLTNSTMIIYILQNLSLCLLISVISLMIFHHNYIIINFLLIIINFYPFLSLIDTLYYYRKNINTMYYNYTCMIKSKSMLNSKMQIIIILL